MFGGGGGRGPDGGADGGRSGSGPDGGGTAGGRPGTKDIDFWGRMVGPAMGMDVDIGTREPKVGVAETER